MKTLSLLIFMVLSGFALLAQEQSPIPKISGQITDYFSLYPGDKVFITTDKSDYKPGETIWFRAFVTDRNNSPVPEENSELFVKLYDKNGQPVFEEAYRMKLGSVNGDFKIPENLQKGNYFLVAYNSVNISTDELSITRLKIDPAYSNQWIVETVLRDSISISGQKNEILLHLRSVSGDALKNTSLRFQFMNGEEIIEKGKLKTDEFGKTKIPVSIPAKTNGEPFICEVSDIRNEWKHEVFLPTNIDPIIIKFYPEGGNLNNGIVSKIGFTAFNKWGIPCDVEGSVVNQEGKPVAPIKTFTKGLGLFSVTKTGNQKYALVLSGKTGLNQSFALPESNPSGLILSVTKTDSAFISTNLNFADQQKHQISITATHGNSLHWASDVEIDKIGRIKIPVENLPQGINLISVFSKDAQLLAERIVFVDKNQRMKITIQPEKKILQPNETMKVKLMLTDENNQPISGNISISVSDKYRIESDRPQIEKYLLIGSELATPFSLISETFEKKINNSALLDVFLISSRLKGFDWAKIRQPKAENAPDQISGNKRISGFVTDKNGIKIHKAKVSLVNNKTMQIHTTTTNVEGYFSFPNLNMVNMDDFTAKATDEDGKRELKIEYSKNLVDQISGYIAENSRKYSLLSTDQFANEIYFENNQDIFVRAPRMVKKNTSVLESQQKYLSKATNLMDVIKTIKPYNIINNQIVFYGSQNSLNYQGGALIVIDGQQMGTEISNIQNISPSEVDHINVSTNPMDIQRYTGLNSVGVIEIFTKGAKSVSYSGEKNRAENRQNNGYKVPSEFPSEPINPKRDMRTTLLWIPEQKVNESGEFEFTVTSGKVISDFVIEVQGISTNGRIGSGKTEFSVIK